MKEVGIINRGMSKIISEQGHNDLLMVVDAGFAIPAEVEVLDVSLRENTPTTVDVLSELKKYHSVEKLILAKQTKDTSPTLFNELINTWGKDAIVEIVEHEELKKLSKTVKAVIRTGDFTAFANVMLVSGAGDRWYCEK